MTMFAPLLITDARLPDWPPRNHTGECAMGSSPANLNHSGPAVPPPLEPLPFDDVPTDDGRYDLADLIDNANDVEGMAEDIAKSASAAYGEACRLSVRIGLVVAENRHMAGEIAELRALVRALRPNVGDGPG